jgi:1-acyl-sn-glycerol-3-phosphate acyltransferase
MTRDPHPFALRVFDALFLPWMRRRIRAVHVAGVRPSLPPLRPLVLVANHVSWWDGFLLREVHRALRPRSPLHFIMLQEELEKHRFFRLLGGIGIRPRSATSVARALRLLEERLQRRPDSVVLFFPQGCIFPAYRRPLGFQPGVELLARRLPQALFLPVALHLEPLTTAAPTAFVALGEPMEAGAATAAALEAAVERELDAVLALLAEHGENAPAAWPPRRAAPAARQGASR